MSEVCVHTPIYVVVPVVATCITAFASFWIGLMAGCDDEVSIISFILAVAAIIFATSVLFAVVIHP